MNETGMLRRSLLKNLIIAVAACWVTWPSFLSPRRAFYVAGVRYHPTRRTLVAADRVLIVPEKFRGEACLAVYSPAGEKLGYVPREKLNDFPLDRTSTGDVLLADPHLPPWRRYYIRVYDGHYGARQSTQSRV